MVEQLGADTLVHGALGDLGDLGDLGAELVVRLGGIHMLKEGESLPMTITSKIIHLFDPETTHRIG